MWRKVNHTVLFGAKWVTAVLCCWMKSRMCCPCYFAQGKPHSAIWRKVGRSSKDSSTDCLSCPCSFAQGKPHSAIWRKVDHSKNQLKQPVLMEPRWRSIYLEISSVSPSHNPVPTVFYSSYIMGLESDTIFPAILLIPVLYFCQQVEMVVRLSDQYFSYCTGYSVLSQSLLAFPSHID
jgi:hypothetical protein